MFDLVIKNAKICDGTGGPSFVGYVAVRDGKIAELERGTAPGLQASRTIDADGLVLMPGIVDPHTHYDAQIAWDPLLTCSPWHGVTTVVQGNCALGLAPLPPEIREIALRDLEHIEDIPYELMTAAIDWQWETFGEYLDFYQKRGVGINVAALVPLNPLRQSVLGEACWERAANDDELKKLEHLLRQSLKEGGWGWSADLSEAHTGYGGRPVASRFADRREFETLSRVLSEAKVGGVEINRYKSVAELSDADMDLLTLVAGLSGKTVTYTGLVNTPENPLRYLQAADKLGDWLDSGRIVPQVFTKPVVLTFGLRNPAGPFGAFKVFQKAMDRPYEEQRVLYQDPEFRAILQNQIDNCADTDKGYLDRTFVFNGGSDEAKALMKTRKPISQYAKERGVKVADCWLDIALNDQLKTEFQVMVVAYEPEGQKNLLRDGRFLAALGDAGAHMQMQNDCGYATHLLGHWCRDNEVVPLEEAVRMITSFPADVFGIKRRGRIKKGNYADFALIEFAKIRACVPEFANDLPGGFRRQICRAEGVEATIVNGQVLFERGEHSGCLPGTMLRSVDE